MSEAANELLVDVMNREQQGSTVWVVDENIQPRDILRIQPRAQLNAITNRIDIQRSLGAANISVELSDFVFSSVVPGTVDTLYFRVGKEKAIVHYVINRAAGLLGPGGKLVLIGAKNEGIKTYIKKAALYLGGEVQQERGNKSSLCATISRGERLGAALDDRQYEELIELVVPGVDAAPVRLVSKPGVYGWNKPDQGSRFLVDELTVYLKTLDRKPASVIDLGCGYGYLSVLASDLLAAEIVATDNNCTAVALCSQNFVNHSIRGRVELADCGDSIRQTFELVICNPPFHQGFSVEGDLTDRFLAAARRLLATEGKALFVVNSFIPLEKLARNYFGRIATLANNKQFKVIQLAV